MRDKMTLVNCKMNPNVKQPKPIVDTVDCQIAALTSGIVKSSSSNAFSNPTSFLLSSLICGTCPVLVSLRIRPLLLIELNASMPDPMKPSDNPMIDSANIPFHLLMKIIHPKRCIKDKKKREKGGNI